MLKLSVFAAEPINTDIWGMSTECLYGVQRPSQSADIGTVLGKIALFVLLPLCIVALITVGIVALVKTSKKKKQAQNVNPQNQNGNTNNPNM